MASAKCAREECGKTVYPLEELKCLDKIWHKGCFKCTECGMTLTMKTYKGYDKKPYCQAHYPKTVASAGLGSLEMDRIKKNTDYQSQVKYHEKYEKEMKGTKIAVADDPELKRHKENTMNASLAHYHGELRKKEEQDSHREAGEQTQASVEPSNGKTVGSIADYNPMATENQQQQSQTQKAVGGGQQQAKGKGAAAAANGFAVKALYDYTAADKDEVSFKEGDVIVNCQKVDDGWMTGTVQRTLLWGMLPANYVEKINQPVGQFKLK